ncbi:MAG: zinc ribbon domain-containing protein [Ardenticatenaceae bacterium]|nr:zinc ribbon domain-containing protein [Ardenticatenaceae bacterium]
MKLGKGTGIILSGLLGIGLLVVLFFFLFVVNRLDSQVYTEEQADFLDYNRGRVINQQALTANFYNDLVGPNALDGTIAPVTAEFAAWENEVKATLRASYDEQGGVSVTVYDLDFESSYHFEHGATAVSTTLELIFPFPANLETLNGVSFMVDGAEPDNVQYTPQNIRWLTTIMPGEAHDIAIRYQADGVNSFAYGLNQTRRTDKLDVQLTVTGLTDSEVPQNSLPTTAVTTPDTTPGQTFIWQYDNLVANRDIHLTLPQRLSFAQRIAALQDDFQAMGNLAPLLVILFVVSTAVVFPWYGIRLPLPTHLLLALGFTLFYPLLTFLSGLVGAILAAIIAIIAIAGLLLFFVKLVAPQTQAVYWVGWLLLVMLGIMSLGMLTPWRGLLVTGGGLLLVAGWMVVYAKRPLPLPDDDEADLEDEDSEPDESQPETIPSPPLPLSPAPLPIFHAHCPQCGRGLTDEYAFCPGCGYDGQHIKHCPTCHHEQVVSDQTSYFCVHCGEKL